jgi:hypothetical protein
MYIDENIGVSGQRKCLSPLCYVRFEPSGLEMKPGRYCCDECRMDAYALRRVAKLYGLSVEDVHEALKGVKKK